jgi:hypothetical protein
LNEVDDCRDSISEITSNLFLSDCYTAYKLPIVISKKILNILMIGADFEIYFDSFITYK